ncbi:MAG: hypothetical protein K0Q53_146 [Massilibacillus sp.]|jgi:NTP pyrophosphatase (non-canonical NTP hydrolase)|nr:hypothetical protein [Massilibacillus sp.]
MIDKDLKTIANHFKYDNQKSKTIEEAEEFLEALEEYHNNKNVKNLEHLTEEIADLEICLSQLKYLIGINQYVEEVKQQKIQRTLERIETGYYSKP